MGGVYETLTPGSLSTDHMACSAFQHFPFGTGNNQRFQRRNYPVFERSKHCHAMSAGAINRLPERCDEAMRHRRVLATVVCRAPACSLRPERDIPSGC